MGLIREPIDVDFSVINRLPTEEETKMISEYILKYKAAHAKKAKTPPIKRGNSVRPIKRSKNKKTELI